MIIKKHSKTLLKFTFLILLTISFSVKTSITSAQNQTNTNPANKTTSNATSPSNTGNTTDNQKPQDDNTANKETDSTPKTQADIEFQKAAELRKDNLAKSTWYFAIVTIMFGVLLIPFMLIIFRAVKYSSATYKSPLGLPDGSLRAMLAYILVTFLGFYILTSILSVSEFKPPEFLLGIIATVIGFYFGSRTGEERETASRTVGNIQGSVTDKDGVSVSGVTVELILSNGKKLNQLTDVKGNYKFDKISVGDYELQASAPGHLPSDKQKVTVKDGEMSNVNLKLK